MHVAGGYFKVAGAYFKVAGAYFIVAGAYFIVAGGYFIVAGDCFPIAVMNYTKHLCSYSLYLGNCTEESFSTREKPIVPLLIILIVLRTFYE